MPDYPVHPIAKCFEMLGQAELHDLAESIERNGQRRPCTLWKDAGGKVWLIDGRNRAAACKLAGVEPTYEYWAGAGSMVELIVDLNIRLRHLEPGQLAMAGLDLLPFYEAEASERQQRGTLATVDAKGKAVAKVAEMLGVSARTIERAKKAKTNGCEELQKALKAGTVSATAAADIAQLPAEEQVRRLNQARQKAQAQRQTTDRIIQVERAKRLLARLERALTELGYADATREAVTAIAGVLSGQ